MSASLRSSLDSTVLIVEVLRSIDHKLTGFDRVLPSEWETIAKSFSLCNNQIEWDTTQVPLWGCSHNLSKRMVHDKHTIVALGIMTRIPSIEAILQKVEVERKRVIVLLHCGGATGIPKAHYKAAKKKLKKHKFIDNDLFFDKLHSYVHEANGQRSTWRRVRSPLVNQLVNRLCPRSVENPEDIEDTE